MAPAHQSGTGVPTLVDCWHVRDLQSFRAVLKCGPAAAGLPSSYNNQGTSHSFSKSPLHSGGHSWSNSIAASLGPATPAEVNRKDLLGRTALHLVASSSEGISIDFLHAILSHPSCNPNVQDDESGWTALHRALYLGNLVHALVILRHPLLDLRLKDYENLTAFDLYNSTVAGTNPPLDVDVKGDLFLWGSNCNYTLGLGDGDDRSLPDLVTLRRPPDSLATKAHGPSIDAGASVGERFDRIKVIDVHMSRMHTVVLTDEKGGGNVWVAGIGSAGRLGRSPSTQSVLTPLADFKETATSLAVGPDHTLIITSSGSMYSFGSNKFGVLGYVLEEGHGLVASSAGSGVIASSTLLPLGAPAASMTGHNKNPDIQITPRRLAGPLKKEIIIGAAASKLHSVAFTDDALYTWGSNTGQLGYNKVASPLQIVPRKVTTLTAIQCASILQVTCTDHATALLLNTFDVLVFHGETSFRVQFPMARFSEKMSAGVFRPPQSQPKPSIARLTSSGTTFAALSDYGDLFTFSLDHPSEYARGAASVTGSSGFSKRRPAPEPQLVWSVRKKFAAVRDVAIGLEGSIILCTSSGHVFVRSRRGASDAKSSSKSGSARAFKFAQIPFLQRVVKVATNESGGFAAIRKPGAIREIKIKGRALEEDLLQLLPHLKIQPSHGADSSETDERQIGTNIDFAAMIKQVPLGQTDYSSDEEDSDVGGSTVQRHIELALLLAEAAKRWDKGEDGQTEAWYGPQNLIHPRGYDMFLICGGKYLPAHRAVLAARIPKLASVLANPPVNAAVGLLEGVTCRKATDQAITLALPDCSFHTALFLLQYIYTDDVPCIWTSSVSIKTEKPLSAAKINRSQVQSQLRELASTLALPALIPVLSSPIPRSPVPTMRADMLSFFDKEVASDNNETSCLHDVDIVLADREVRAHSVFLSRSPFFEALLKPVWTAWRWKHGRLRIDLRNFRWESMTIHLRHIYADLGVDAFKGKDSERSLEEWIDFLTEILASSDELLLDKLKLAASLLLRARILPQNISAILTIADTYHAIPLKEASLLYCAQNLECLLEMGMLDELGHKMVRELSSFIQRKQDERLHRTRSADHVAELLAKHHEYFKSLDIPPPSLNLVSFKARKRGPRSAAAQTALDAHYSATKRRGKNKGVKTSPTLSPDLPAASAPGGNGNTFFDMDEDELDVGSTQARSPSLLAIANLNLGSPPTWSGLPKAQESIVSYTTWSALRNPSTENRASPMVSKQPTPSFPQSNNLRSIMAAEQAMLRPSPVRRNFLSQVSGVSTPASVVRTGTQTPLRVSSAQENIAVSSYTDISHMTISAKLSQKDRKRQQQTNGKAQAGAMMDATTLGRYEPSATTLSQTVSPWKLPEPRTAPAVSHSSTQMQTQKQSAERLGKTEWSTRQSKHRAGAANGSQPAQQPRSRGLGPTYTPTKVVPQNNVGGCHTPGGRASSSTEFSWSGPVQSDNTPLPAPQRPTLATLSTQKSQSEQLSLKSLRPTENQGKPALEPASSLGPSFAQIQAQQAAAASSEAESSSQRKKSFMQIQDEERRIGEAERLAEKERADFEKWFEEESRRVKREGMLASKGSKAVKNGSAKTSAKITGGSGNEVRSAKDRDKPKKGSLHHSSSAPEQTANICGADNNANEVDHSRRHTAAVWQPIQDNSFVQFSARQKQANDGPVKVADGHRKHRARQSSDKDRKRVSTQETLSRGPHRSARATTSAAAAVFTPVRRDSR